MFPRETEWACVGFKSVLDTRPVEIQRLPDALDSNLVPLGKLNGRRKQAYGQNCMLWWY